MGRGIPTDLTFDYVPADFAKNRVEVYPAGARNAALVGVYGWSSADIFAFISFYPFRSPSTIQGWYLRSRHLTWITDVAAGRSPYAPDLVDRRRIPRDGVTMAFFKGPVAPVQDRGLAQGRVSAGCGLCVLDGRLRGHLAAISSGATAQRGDPGTPERLSWSIRRGNMVLAGGVRTIDFRGIPVRAGQRLTLEVTTRMKWRLSDRSTSRYRFRVPKGESVVPLLRSDWSVPMRMDGVVDSRRVRFPLRFDNVGPADHRIVRAAVSYSTDGKTWRAAGLVRTGGPTFQVRYPNPVGAGRVSLRVSATDARGNTSSERISHVYYARRR